MRLFAVCALLAMSLASPSLCERRNYAVCSLDDSDFQCQEGQFCNVSSGQTVGMCMDVQCNAAANTCAVDVPICTDGRCTKCGNDNQCDALKRDTPICDSGRCVACRPGAGDCKDPLKAICDATTHTCRPCQLHSDCTSGVCAKDASFAGLPAPIPMGTCVDSSRINVCNGCSSIVNALTNVDQNRPYLVIKNFYATGQVTIPNTKVKDGSLPRLYIVGPNADLAPSKLTSTPAINFSNGSGSAIFVSPGANVTLEGVIITGSKVGLECGADGSTSTNLKFVRSYIGSVTGTGSMAIKVGDHCNLTLDSSWVGKGPDPQLAGTGNSANDKIMQLDSASLDIINSVFFHNGTGTSGFGGISVTDSKSLGLPIRIINSTFYEQLFSDARQTLILDCPAVNSIPVIVANSLFVNSAAVVNPITYIHQSCRQNFTAVGVGSNDASLNGSGNFTDVSDTIFSDKNAGNFHFSQSAGANVKDQGVKMLTPSGQPMVPIPSTDMDGTPRGESVISIGAFEASR